MSRSVVFNESVMYHDDLSTYTFDVEPQRVTVQVEHFDEEEHVIADNDDVAPDAQVDDNVDDAPDTEVHDDDVVQHSPLFCSDKFSLLQPVGEREALTT